MVGDVDLYCHTALEAMATADELTVEVERTFFSKKLVLYGIQMESH